MSDRRYRIAFCSEFHHIGSIGGDWYPPKHAIPGTIAVHIIGTDENPAIVYTWQEDRKVKS